MVSPVHTWAARYDTWFLTKLMPKGVVCSFPFSSVHTMQIATSCAKFGACKLDWCDRALCGCSQHRDHICLQRFEDPEKPNVRKRNIEGSSVLAAWWLKLCRCGCSSSLMTVSDKQVSREATAVVVCIDSSIRKPLTAYMSPLAAAQHIASAVLAHNSARACP